MVGSKKVYFPGLNGIRFLAALSVVMHHIEYQESRFKTGHAGYFLTDFFMRGSDAITLFFVLSGFLITYLLLVERYETGTINVRKFYARRILRIWPVYYMVVFIAFAILPTIVQLIGYNGYWLPTEPERKLWIYLLILPNIVGFFGVRVVALGHLWSIGIEEQFYLIWPHIMKRLGRHLLVTAVAIIVIKFIIINIDTAIVANSSVPQVIRILVSFLTNLRFESMAVGAIGAYLIFFNKEKVLSVIFHPIMEKTVLVLMIGIFAIFSAWDEPRYNLLMSVIYMLFILNVSCNPRSTVKLTHPILDHLGRVSYGIYMYHNSVIVLLVIGLSYTGIPQLDSFTYNTILYALAISLTIGVSLLSYAKFEKPLLRLKNRFTVVRSGDRPAEVGQQPAQPISPAPVPEAASQ